MLKRQTLFLLLLLAIGSFAAGDSVSTEYVEKGVFGFGYDEGLSGRVFITDRVSTYLSIGYYMKSPDTTGRNILNEVSLKIGGEYRFLTFDRLAVGAFGEVKEKMIQGEVDAQREDNTFMRYNRWDTSVRLGIRPEFFITPHISLDYKFGIQFDAVGSDYELNEDGSGLKKMDNDYQKLGLYSTDVISKMSPEESYFFNMGLTFYVKNFRECKRCDYDYDSIPNAADKCPKKAEDMDNFEDQDGCPDLDNDNDGVEDKVDPCPTVSEDFDGFEDDDGCPDLDNDKDGIADTDDGCPGDSEDFDGFEDEDGCPELDNDRDGVPDVKDSCVNAVGPIENNGCPISIDSTLAEIVSEGITFASGKTDLLRESYPVMDQIVDLLKNFPPVTLEIQGYTDSSGSAAENQRLSQKRAETVMSYLMTMGIDQSRLTAKGYGSENPIQSNDTPEGRVANRRIEMKRTDI